MREAGDQVAPPAWLMPASGGVGALVSWTAVDGGPRLASTGTDGTVQIWDPQRAAAIGAPLAGHRGNVFRLAVCGWSGRRLLASASEDGTVRVWDVGIDAPTSITLSGHEGWVQALAFWRDADGWPRLASGGTDGTVRLWDPLAGDLLGEPLCAGEAGVTALTTWSTDQGARLAVADAAGTISVWDPQRCRLVADGPDRTGGGVWTLVAWTARDGTARLAAGGQDGVIHIWSPVTGGLVVEPLRGHASWVPALVTWTVADGGTRLGSASTDGTVRLWNGDTGAPIGATLTGSSGAALAALAVWVGPGGRRRLATVGQGGAIRSYDVETGEPAGAPLVGHVAGIWALASWPDPDGTRLAVGGDDGAVRIWNADTGQAVASPLAGHTAAVWSLAAWRTGDGSVRLASTGDDATIRVWALAGGRPAGALLTGHTGWVPGLAVWQRPGGATALASAGADGTVRRWDLASHTEIGDPLPGHDGPVMTVTTWHGRHGVRLASGGVDGTVQLWDPERGEPVGAPLAGHIGWVRSLTVWQDAQRTLLVSGSFDGTIRIWDADTGMAVGEPLTGHQGRVAAVAAWTGTGGGARLASAGLDSVIRLWDLDTGEPIGAPLTGHVAGIWALTSWRDPRSGVRLASAGHDGSVRLWDPEAGRAIRTIEVGPVTVWGLSDAPTRRDVIGRQVLADAIADQLRRPVAADRQPGDGPTVISVEGPWGCGKSTLMNLVRERLAGAPPASARGGNRRHLTVRAVLGHIRRFAATRGKPAPPPAGTPGGEVTAWFNPWAYQSGEHVWAGLTNEIIEAAAEVLYPTEPDRERYWLVRNLGRIDRYALRRSLLRRTRSPILGLAAAALVGTTAVSIAGLDQSVVILATTVSPFAAAVAVTVLTVLAGAGHTSWRRWFGTAVTYLPAELLSGPVADGTRIDGDEQLAEPDPLRRARSGALYLHQHDVGDLVDDLAAAGSGLVVFVDDLDRCRASTIAEVFEAINLFLSNLAARTGLRARFVVGIDSAVVASHLDSASGGGGDPTVARYGDDPTPGWSFLRKLVQLPVLVPQIPDDGVGRLVDAMTGSEPELAPANPGGGARVVNQPAGPPPSRPAGAGAARPDAARVPVPRTPVDTFPWRSAEQHPRVRELLVRRLSGQSYRSIREAKRLVNVWQFYERIMEAVEPLSQPDEMVVRACRLLVLAEIVTRWPALQRALHRRVDGQRGLQLLAAVVEDDSDWQRAASLVGIDTPAGERARADLRDLLRYHDGRAVADLAARLM